MKFLNFTFVLLLSYPYMLSANFLDEFDQTWVNEFGAKGYSDGYYIRGEYDSPRDSVVNSDGDMIIVGQTEGNLSGDTTEQQYCGFITKINSDGISKWTNQCKIGGYQYGSAVGVAIDNNNNIFILARGADGPFLAKMDNNKNIIWYKNFHIANGSEDIYSLYVSKDGTAYVSGVYRSDDYTKPGHLYLIKFSPDGTSYETHLFGTFEADRDSRPVGMEADSKGNIYITGYTNNNTFDGEVNSGSYDIFLSKFNISGDLLWSKLFGSQTAPEHQLKSELARSVYIDRYDNIYIAGDTAGNLGGRTNSGNYDMFVVKFSDNGNISDTFLVGANNLENPQYGASDHVNDITVDSSGNIYLFGNTSGQFSGENTNGGGYNQLALVKLNAKGEYLWAKQFGKCCPRHDDEGVSLSQDRNGNLYLLSRVSQYLGKYYNTRFPDIAAIKLTLLGDKFFSLIGSTEITSSSKIYDSTKFKNSIIAVGIGYNSSNTTIDYLNLDTNFSNQFETVDSNSKQLPTSIHAATVDNNGNNYIIGSFYINGSYDEIAVSKYSPDKTLLWSKHYGASGGMTMPTSIIYSDNTLYICGYTEGNIDNNADNIGNGIHRIDGFVMSLRSDNGDKKWIQQFKSSDNTPLWIRDIDMDINKTIHVVGMSGVATGPVVVNSFSKDGTFISSKRYGANITNEGMGISANDNSLYIAATSFGKFSNEVDSYGNSDMVLMKIDENDPQNAHLIWVRQFGSSGYDTAYDIDTDSKGNLFVVGYTNGNLYATNSGEKDMILQYYSSNGVLLASKQTGTDTKDIAYSVKTDNSDGIVVAGSSKGLGIVQYYKIEDNSTVQTQSNNTLYLTNGWNLISANLDINTLHDDISIVWQYHNGVWQAYSPKEEIRSEISSRSFQLLDNIKTTNGTWILSSSNQTIEQYNNNSATDTTTYKSGWTLAGTAKDLSVNSIVCANSGIKTIWKFKENIWKVSAARDTKYDSFDIIYKNEGFWIYCSE